MFCRCQQDNSLSEYVLVYVDNPADYVNHDYIRKTGVIVDFVEREHPLLRNHRSSQGARIIKAFTIADAFRLVEWEQGNLDRKPKHRILSLPDKEELTTCSLRNEAFADLTQAALARFMSSP